MTHSAPNPYAAPMQGLVGGWNPVEAHQQHLGAGFVQQQTQQYEALCSEMASIRSGLEERCRVSQESKRNLDLLRDELAGVKAMAMELFEEAKRSQTISSKPSPTEELQATVYQNKPGCCESLSALLLTIIALVSITILACCLVAACGGFPLLMTILNACSLGAIVSLPILASVSSTVVTLSILATYMILNAHSYRVELSRVPSREGTDPSQRGFCI
ncbi:inclusion membrane protein IncB [Chlamydiifrater phoenicopteri]|uniref:inclusion membrane protein IncB n=1 Tax=Chlamydiifrater phoenicopteri TaxID=2681469 RepID=UPI001BD1AC4C|nr:inclusion membrane protein IncB [Chlamydiifrater phoenicopteri]